MLALVKLRITRWKETHFVQLFLILCHQTFVDCNLWGLQGGSCDELKGRISRCPVGLSFSEICSDRYLPNKLSCQPKERLFEVVVRLGRDFIILNIFLSVESHCCGLHFSLL